MDFGGSCRKVYRSRALTGALWLRGRLAACQGYHCGMVPGNRLSAEASLYLLQHQNDPVAWWPWCDEAFEEARRLDRPVFVSIGYSTCHWCHVMARESFQSAEVADALNAHFVSIKVDREERPDVDELYMNAVQLMQHGQGGWPMTLFVDPERRHPFYAGTYYPPHDVPGRPSFLTLLRAVLEAWKERRDTILEQAAHVARTVASMQDLDRGESEPDADGVERLIDRAVVDIMGTYDRTHGGFGRGPNKFPTPPIPALLMDAAWERPDVRAATVHSVERMVLGGLHDQIGGGFHRYSTDVRWLVPHFEKMLYDTAQLLPLLADLSVRTGEERDSGLFAFAARRAVEWVAREMTAPDGSFHAALDADVDHHEGLGTVWSPERVAEALRAEGLGDEIDRVLRWYAMDGPPNFQDPHDASAASMWIPHLTGHPAVLAEEIGVGPASWPAWRDRVDAALLRARRGRPEPARDDKILTAWNGLMIEGLADAGRLLDQPEWIDRAARAADAALATVVDAEGSVARVRYGSRIGSHGFLDDAASLAGGLLSLARATGETRWRDAALSIVHAADKRFGEAGGGWFDADAAQHDLFTRPRSVHDGAVPGGYGQMMLVCARLAQSSGDAPGDAWSADRARRALSAHWGTLTAHPAGAPAALRAAVLLGPNPG